MKDRHADYFEGILQIRGGTEEIIRWVRNKVKKDGKARIAKEKKVRGGVDLYISSQHYLQRLGSTLRKTYPGVLKISQRLHTQDKMSGKRLYRVSVLYRPIPFKRKDIVKLHGEEFEILRIAEKAHLKNVKSGEKKLVDLDRLLRIRR